MDDITPPKAAINRVTPKLKLPPTDVTIEPAATDDPTNLDIVQEPTKDKIPSNDTTPQEDKLSPMGRPPIKDKWYHFGIPKLRRANLSKKQWALVYIAAAILLVGGALGAYYLYKHFTKQTPLSTQSQAVKHVAKPTTVASRLTGLSTSPDLNNRPITGIMIENSPDARPQAGLIDAGVVYEAIAEGGITRFLALFEEAQPDYIGPVRSARPYYLDFVLPFQGSLAHVGGSPEGLADIKSLHVRDLDEFANSATYWRVTTRFAPHNVYTSSARLDSLEKSKGYSTSTFTGFPRKKDAPVKTPTVGSIDLSISGVLYNVHYDYDATTNSYKRSEGGKPHMDEKSNKQLAPKVVIAPVMTYNLESDAKHSQYGDVGSGQVYIFQDGTVTKGTWSKASRTDQIVFKDAQGKAVALNAGQTWISLVSSASAVTYKP